MTDTFAAATVELLALAAWAVGLSLAGSLVVWLAFVVHPWAQRRSQRQASRRAARDGLEQLAREQRRN